MGPTSLQRKMDGGLRPGPALSTQVDQMTMYYSPRAPGSVIGSPAREEQ